MKNKIVKILIIGIVIATAAAATNYGIEKSEINECNNWAKEIKIYTGYFLADWQKEQCENYGIKVEIPKPQIGTGLEIINYEKIDEVESIRQPAKISWYDYDLPENKQWSINHRTTAARDWPRGTMLKVCRQDETAKCVEVLVNDYGPDKSIFPDRVLDLSSYAFGKLFPLSQGVGIVTISEVE